MIELRWTEAAAGDLESIRDYIRHDSPIIAQLVATRLYDAVSMLRDFSLTVFHAARMFPADIVPPAR